MFRRFKKEPCKIKNEDPCISSVRCTSFKKATHVIFDLDGTLLDTEPLYYKIFYELAAKYDKIYTEEVRSKHIGLTHRDACFVIKKSLNIPATADEIYAIYREIAFKKIGSLALMPGAERIVSHLFKNKIPMAVASSSSKESYDIKTKKHTKFFKNFHHVILQEDAEVKRLKPHPDIYLTTASRFDDKPACADILVFEDVPNGVKAAIAAGMQCVYVPDGQLMKDQPELMRCPEATITAKSLETIKIELFGLPSMG